MKITIENHELDAAGIAKYAKMIGQIEFSADDRKGGARIEIKGRAGAVDIQASTVNRDQKTTAYMIGAAILDHSRIVITPHRHAANA